VLVKEGYHGWKARTTKQHVAPNGTRFNRENGFNLKDIKLLLGDTMEMDLTTNLKWAYYF
jgi:hypothetical protein